MAMDTRHRRRSPSRERRQHKRRRPADDDDRREEPRYPAAEASPRGPVATQVMLRGFDDRLSARELVDRLEAEAGTVFVHFSRTRQKMVSHVGERFCSSNSK